MSRTALILIVLTLVRLLVAGFVPLSPDEAYYWVWSRALAPGYLDHPPMVALWIRAGTAIAGNDPLGVRLLAPISALLGSWFAAIAGRDLLDLDRRGRIATVMLLNATLMVGAGAVTMTPDTPLLLFWTATLACLGRLHRSGAGRWLIASGACLGLAFCSKYTALLLLPPIAFWLLLTRGRRALLRMPAAWLAALVSLSFVSPVLAWNAAHGFASFSKQGGRLLDVRLAAALRFVPELVAGQLGLATPLVAFLFCAGVWRVTRQARAGEPGAALVSLATLFPAAIFVLHALGDRVQANWPSVLYPGAALAAGVRPRALVPAAVSGLTITALVYLQATLHPLALPPRSDPTQSRLAGWAGLAAAAGRAEREFGAPLATDEYSLAAELAWYQAAPRILAYDARWRFVRLPRLTHGATPVLLVRTTRRAAPPDPKLWMSAIPVATLIRASDGRAVERYVIFRAISRPGATAAVLPAGPA